MQNNNQLLETLAQQLGTTVEYLWGVLLKQAPVSATIDLVTCLLLIAFMYGTWRLHRYYSAPINDDEDYLDCTRYEENDLAIIIVVVFGVVSLVMLFCILSAIPGIINGYFNPEYWALKEILNSVK